MRKKCPNCRVELVEVRKVYDPKRAKRFGFKSNYFIDYPKEIPLSDKIFNEYRFVCRKCKSEWVYDTSVKLFLKIPKSSQYKYSWNKKVLISRKQ